VGIDEWPLGDYDSMAKKRHEALLSKKIAQRRSSSRFEYRSMP
jgi:hypothetical protein